MCRDADSLVAFYTDAFGFTRVGHSIPDNPALAALTTLRLGHQTIVLAQARPSGHGYPSDVAGWSPLFQHIAIVASDMTAAYARLRALVGWTAISTDGPQTLPPSSGGVTAFKFRDPEGHPLELLAFASGAAPARWAFWTANPCLGIDHSAISVAESARSVTFYDRLGLVRTAGSLNVGPEQAKLDDVTDPVVEVTALASPTHSTPHVELLCYRGNFNRRIPPADVGDVAATQFLFEVKGRDALDALVASNREAVVSGPIEQSGCLNALLRDPDGHLLCLQTPLTKDTSSP